MKITFNSFKNIKGKNSTKLSMKCYLPLLNQKSFLGQQCKKNLVNFDNADVCTKLKYIMNITIDYSKDSSAINQCCH